MTISRTTLSIVTFSILILRKTTLSKMTFSIITQYLAKTTCNAEHYCGDCCDEAYCGLLHYTKCCQADCHDT